MYNVFRETISNRILVYNAYIICLIANFIKYSNLICVGLILINYELAR